MPSTSKYFVQTLKQLCSSWLSCASSLSHVRLCDLMDCSPPGSSVHGDSPGKNTGVGCHALLQGESSQPSNQTQTSNTAADFFYCLSHQGSPRLLEWVAYPFSRRSSWSSYQTRSPALQADSLPAGLPGNFIQLINDPFFRNYNWGRENF